jgi:transposase InsO family protein
VSSVGLTRLARRCRDVEGPACGDCRDGREAQARRSGPVLWGGPVLGLHPAPPVPGRRRGGVRAAVAAAQGLAVSDQPGHCGADRGAAQGPGRAGPGRRAAHHLLAPGTPPPDPGLGGHRQPHPGPPGPGHPRCREAAEVACIRFAAEQPNECWQSDFTHYPLASGQDTEILTWLDDHSRYALSLSAHIRVTGPAVLAAFRAAAAAHGAPASTLTDNGLVFTTRFAGGRGGRNALEAELCRLGITQKNGKPNHPQTQGKVERFQQTMKNWLRAQHAQPATLADLQSLLDNFAVIYNTRRPHRSLPHRATPATAYAARPKAQPGDRTTGTHNRVRTDRTDPAGKLTLRVSGKLHHIGTGSENARTPVLMLVQDLHVRILPERRPS